MVEPFFLCPSRVVYFLFRAAVQISLCCIRLAISSFASALLRRDPCGEISKFAGSIGNKTHDDIKGRWNQIESV